MASDQTDDFAMDIDSSDTNSENTSDSDNSSISVESIDELIANQLQPANVNNPPPEDSDQNVEDSDNDSVNEEEVEIAIEFQEDEYPESENDEELQDPNENVQNDFFIVDHEINPNDWEEELQLEVNVEEASNDGISNASDEDQGDHEISPPPEFDPQLPTRHVYLGEAMEELQGRTVLEEAATPEIPLVVMSLHLVPGQTLPMTISHSVFQNAIRRCVVNDRVFGIVSSGQVSEGLDGGRSTVHCGSLGTLAEIYEFQEESEDHNPMQPIGSSFAIKAKGRQRFNVIDIRRQGDGNLMGRVKIRPELKMLPFMNEIFAHNTLRYQFPVETPPIPTPLLEVEMDEAAVTDSSNEVKAKESEYEAGLAALIAENDRRRKVAKCYSRQTPWPSFVYANMDERYLVERVHRMLKNELTGVVESKHTIPLDPTELSFWLAQNLTMDDTVRFQLLGMDSPIQRLRYELNLLSHARVVCCRRCKANIASHSDIFAMSIEGPQGTYVNPAGYVHETLTVSKANDLVSRGIPSTQASWFPGYSWIIVECRGCRTHLGWKFQAVGRLQPKKFWGLARTAVTFKYDLGSDDDDFDVIEQRLERARKLRARAEAMAAAGIQPENPPSDTPQSPVLPANPNANPEV